MFCVSVGEVFQRHGSVFSNVCPILKLAYVLVVQVVRRIPKRYFEDSDATNHLTENGSVRGGTAMAESPAAPHRGVTGGSMRNSSAAVDILASGRNRGGGSLKGGTSAAEALGISRLSGSLRGGSLAQEALNRQFAE